MSSLPRDNDIDKTYFTLLTRYIHINQAPTYPTRDIPINMQIQEFYKFARSEHSDESLGHVVNMGHPELESFCTIIDGRKAKDL